jgi:hypothetical protein
MKYEYKDFFHAQAQRSQRYAMSSKHFSRKDAATQRCEADFFHH